VHQINEIVNDFLPPSFDGPRFEPSLRRAIEQDDAECEPKPPEAEWKMHVSLSIALE
jgi:hypothetical protein